MAKKDGKTSTEVATTDNGPSNYPVPVNDKPLNQTQAKNLKQIVDLDFEDLMTSVMREIDKMAQEKIDRLEALNDPQKQADAHSKLQAAANEAAAKANETFQKVLDKTKDEFPGLDFSSVGGLPFPMHPGIGTPNPGMQQAINRAKRAHQRLRNSAASIIDREHRQIDRLILVQTISAASAAELMNDLPEAQDIITLIRTELEVENDGDIEVLMSDDFDAQQYVEVVVEDPNDTHDYHGNRIRPQKARRR